MRRPALYCILALAGCGRDPCAHHDGACVALTARGPYSVDELAVALSTDNFQGSQNSDVLSAPEALPLSIALFLPEAATDDGDLAIEVTGFAAAQSIAVGSTTTAPLRAGEHRAVEVILGNANGGDGAAGDDGGASDGGRPPADLRGADLSGAPPTRYVFVLNGGGAGGAVSNADADCDQQGKKFLRAASSYVALLGGPSRTATDAFAPAGRRIILPDGTQVATDETFWTAAHLSPIGQTADKRAPA